MKKASILALLTAVVISIPACADSSRDVDADARAVHKDNHALAKDNVELAKDRAQKAQDKANGNWGGQAVDSMAIGVDHTLRGEKGAEKSLDKKILHNDTTEVNQ
ncbi:MAG: hypothetical protein M3N08_05970 [Pseudomonadota bacterium]|nr:hypothetical protein [Pseudomonadota bacterium]